MKRNRFKVEEIIRRLRKVEVHLSQGKSVAQASRGLGVMQQAYYRWLKECGGMKVFQDIRLREFEQENARLKRAVADSSH